MTTEQYRDLTFQRRSLEMIEQANTIINEYADQGFTLTLRQLFYQFVARGLIANTLQRYSSLGWTVSNGRDAGLIDWDAIEDRSREFKRPATWGHPGEILDVAASQYREDLWKNQPRHIELWVEKDAVSGVFARVCADYRLPFLAHRGNASTTITHEAGVRLAERIELGQEPLILHFTDHDPTGLDMRRDVEQRLERYARESIEVRVLGLTREQVDLYNPPANPAKITDPRYAAYVREHGTESWELDALSPEVLDQLARDAIEAELDHDTWTEALDHERRSRTKLTALVKKMTPKRGK
jgi:hypothetical protein